MNRVPPPRPHGIKGTTLVLPFLAEAGWDALAHRSAVRADLWLRGAWGAYGLSDFVADLLSIAEDWAGASGRVQFVGHSFGGVVSARCSSPGPTSSASITPASGVPTG